jgi:hypothetical protein
MSEKYYDLKVTKYGKSKNGKSENGESTIIGCPIMKELEVFHCPVPIIDEANLKIAELMKSRVIAKKEGHHHRLIDMQIASLNYDIAHLRYLRELVDEVILLHERLYLKHTIIRSFLLEYAKSPTGDIGTSFHSYLGKIHLAF